MSRGETTLPHRVASSAKQLVRSTVSGIESEYGVPDAGKQTGSSSRAPSQSGSSRDKTVPRRPEPASRENSFRSQVSAATLHAVEEDFDRFQEQRYFEAQDYFHNAAYSTSFSDFNRFQEALNEEGYSSIQPYDEMNNQAFTNDTSANIDLPDSKISDSKTSETTRRPNLASMRSSSALRRLNQVGAHMQRNLALQEAFQQKIDTQSIAATHTSLLNTSQSSQYRHAREPNLSHEPRPTQKLHQTHQTTPQPTPPSRKQFKQKEESEDKIPLETQFHCPYYACHQNLLHHTSDSSTDAGGRACVHVGCTFQAESLKGWSDHVVLPHHDLQGGLGV